jgi:hypothetical protein
MNLKHCLGPAPLDTDTFLTLLFVQIDDFFQREGTPEARRPGPKAALNRSEVLCLVIFGQWGCFGSERDFSRYASRHVRAAFPDLGAYSQFNRWELSLPPRTGTRGPLVSLPRGSPTRLL